MKMKASKAERISGLSEEDVEPLRSAQLQGGDLKDGLRMLILQEGKFWPARLNSTKLPDVYGVTMERQRGNRPIILPRDDILKEAVRERERQQIMRFHDVTCRCWRSDLGQSTSSPWAPGSARCGARPTSVSSPAPSSAPTSRCPRTTSWWSWTTGTAGWWRWTRSGCCPQTTPELVSRQLLIILPVLMTLYLSL